MLSRIMSGTWKRLPPSAATILMFVQASEPERRGFDLREGWSSSRTRSYRKATQDAADQHRNPEQQSNS
jgi:hypothetical protein